MYLLFICHLSNTSFIYISIYPSILFYCIYAYSLLFVFLKPWLNCILHVNRRLSTIYNLWLLSVLSVQDGAYRVPAGPRFLLLVYLLFSHVSFINTFKHVKDALYVILWFLYCLGFLSIEQILFVIYPSSI